MLKECVKDKTKKDKDEKKSNKKVVYNKSKKDYKEKEIIKMSNFTLRKFKI